MSRPRRVPPATGQVFLVGAGPGDPELITVRGLRLLRTADTLVYDRLVHPDLLDEVPTGAERIYVGKVPGGPSTTQAEIHRVLIYRARQGRRVVRLKGGDPFVFGRGSEEAQALTDAGIPWQVVPAVSSALAVPALAGIPVTERRAAASFAVVTGMRVTGQRVAGSGNSAVVDSAGVDWEALARIDTLVVLMGVSALPEISAALIRHGRPPATPAAIIERGSLPDERVLVGSLEEIAKIAANACVRPPATLVVGEVVHRRRHLHPAAAMAAPITISALSAPAPQPTASPSSGSRPSRAAASRVSIY